MNVNLTVTRGFLTLTWLFIPPTARTITTLSGHHHFGSGLHGGGGRILRNVGCNAFGPDVAELEDFLDGVDEVLDDSPPDFPLIGLVRRERPVGQHQPDFAARREMVDHVLDPGVVRVPRRRYPVGPAHVLLQPLLSPPLEIERRIGEDEVCLATIFDTITC